jgi:C-terminal processing protease CtpA/Prc
MSLAVFADALLGKEGTSVDLAIMRGGKGDLVIVTCTRSVIRDEEAQHDGAAANSSSAGPLQQGDFCDPSSQSSPCPLNPKP